MTLGYGKPLHLLARDDCGSYETGPFGATPPVSPYLTWPRPTGGGPGSWRRQPGHDGGCACSFQVEPQHDNPASGALVVIGPS